MQSLIGDFQSKESGGPVFTTSFVNKSLWSFLNQPHRVDGLDILGVQQSLLYAKVCRLNKW